MTSPTSALEQALQEAADRIAQMDRLREQCSDLQAERDSALRRAVLLGMRPPQVARRVGMSTTAVRNAAYGVTRSPVS